MSKSELLQAKAADLPEPIASEVLDFLDFLMARRRDEAGLEPPDSIVRFRGAFKGRLSSSLEFASQKANEVRMEG